MDLRIIYKDGDGVSVIIPKLGEKIDDILAKDLPEGSDYKIVDVSGIPENRAFREAWKYEDGLRVDMTEAIEIQKNRWREVRKKILENLDIDFMRAQEEGDDEKKKTISEKKQILRDVTEMDLSSTSSLEELHNTWPDCLK